MFRIFLLIISVFFFSLQLQANDNIELKEKLCKNLSENECFYKIVNAADVLILREKGKRDYSKIIEGYKKLCDKNFAKACRDLGHKYQGGVGVKQDINKSISLYKKASKYGEHGALIDIANIYGMGIYVKKDKQKAKVYYQKACEKDKKNCFMLKYINKKNTKKEDYKEISSLEDKCKNSKMGLIYCSAVAITYLKHNDADKAKSILEFACKKGSSADCYTLGHVYLNENDMTSYEYYLNKSCYSSNFMACNDLGNYYSRKDSEISKKYFKKACDLGYQEACFSFSKDKALKDRKEYLIFDEKKYLLSWIAKDKEQVLNEYLLKGASLYDWQTLLSVRRVRTNKNLKNSTKWYLKQIESHFTREPTFYEFNNHNMTIAELVLMPKDKSYLEYDLLKFKKERGFLYVYQYAYKIPKDGNANLVSNLEMKRQSWFNAMEDIKLKIVHK